MEATPKVHRHRHRRSESRHRRTATEQQQQQHEQPSTENSALTAAPTPNESEMTIPTTITATATTTTSLSLDSSDCHEVFSQSSQQTVVLINGHVPTTMDDSVVGGGGGQNDIVDDDDLRSPKDAIINVDELTVGAASLTHLESPTQSNPGGTGGGGGGGGGGGSSRNSSGDALSLRETLQQLPSSITAPHHHHHHHHHHRGMRRTHSPQSPQTKRSAAQEIVDSSFHRGILGFMDRELKQSSPTPSALSVGGSAAGGSTSSGRKPQQSLSDPQASPAQRSLRSRSSIEKSPRRKRSKSESRRRRERKLIAAGEMEVRQANETLMRYLKQCSEMNDASLSGELEIDQSYDERRVHRKTKSQRDKRGHLISKLYTAGGLSSILKELSDDIVPADGDEIYNPFTPVVSPTEDTPAHIDKMFLQTSSGYRPVEHSYYKHSFVGNSSSGAGGGVSGGGGFPNNANNGAEGPLGDGSGGRGMRPSRSYGDTRYLLDAECGRSMGIDSSSELACVVQRFWLLIANICHGLLAGLALAHLIFALTTTSTEWSMFLNHVQLSEPDTNLPQAVITATPSSPPYESVAPDLSGHNEASIVATATLADYSLFVQIYLNTFYCLTIVCLVSVLDRMDICRWDLSNATEMISFRWLIIAMIYIATIVLTICSDALEKRLYYSSNANVTISQDELHSNMILGVWSSLSVTRSIGAICGWIMIGLTPQEDLLYEHLIELTKYRLING